VLRDIEDAIEELDDAAAMDDERIRHAARAAVRRALKLARDKRPIIEVQITRLGKEALADLLDETEPAR
jgi:ribonuclease J